MKKYKFQAQIEEAHGGGACVLFPFDVEQEFGTKGRVAVKAMFDRVPYTGSLVKYGNPRHMLGVSKAIREQIGKGPGDRVEVELVRDEEVRTVEMPVPFEQAMKRHGVREIFDALSFTHRKEYCRWIAEAKKEETRARRLEKAIEMLGSGIKTPG